MENQFRDLMEKAGLSKYTDAILNSRMNSIFLHAEWSDGDVPDIGKSKIGGRPDMPAGYEWPTWTADASPDHKYQRIWEEMAAEWKEHGSELEDRPVGSPLSFVAQINLADAKPHDLEDLLPDTGMLWFFYDTELQPGGMSPEDPGGWRVLYSDAGDMPLKRKDWPEDLPAEARFRALSLSFSHELTWPQSDSVFIKKMGLSFQEECAYSEQLGQLLLPYDWRIAVHRMLGHPDHEQGDAFMQAEHDANGLHYRDSAMMERASEWVLLLQVDSVSRACNDEGMMWGDVGQLFCCIRKRIWH